MPRVILGLAVVCVTAAAPACTSLQGPAPVELVDHGRRPPSSALVRLRARADARPEDFRAQFDAGMAHMHATLDGDLGQRDRAERYLERAWRLDPGAQATAPVLARFLNLRSAALDFSRVELQVELYAWMAGGATPRVREAEREAFTNDCFLEAARAMREYAAGRTAAAYARVARIERRLARRLRRHPDEIDTHAMAGNYALGFAGALPLGRARRLGRAIEHLEIQQAHWDELSAGARAESVAPNVRAVWTFMLAEALTAAGRIERAEPYYRAVSELHARDTGPGAQLASVGRERVRNLAAYAGRRELLPVWPAGAASCMACHSTHARLPTDGLFVLERAADGGAP